MTPESSLERQKVSTYAELNLLFVLIQRIRSSHFLIIRLAQLVKSVTCGGDADLECQVICISPHIIVFSIHLTLYNVFNLYTDAHASTVVVRKPEEKMTS